MADLAAQIITVNGLTPNFVAATVGGDTAPIGDGITLEVQNANGTTAHDVTIVVPGDLVTGDAFPDKTYSVPISGELRIPMLRAFRDPADARAHITYPSGGEADLSLAVTQRGSA